MLVLDARESDQVYEVDRYLCRLWSGDEKVCEWLRLRTGCEGFVRIRRVVQHKHGIDTGRRLKASYCFDSSITIAITTFFNSNYQRSSSVLKIIIEKEKRKGPLRIFILFSSLLFSYLLFSSLLFSSFLISSPISWFLSLFKEKYACANKTKTKKLEGGVYFFSLVDVISLELLSRQSMAIGSDANSTWSFIDADNVLQPLPLSELFSLWWLTHSNTIGHVPLEFFVGKVWKDMRILRADMSISSVE